MLRLGEDEADFSPAGNENSNTFGEVGEVDIMQMALKMATELDEPSNDLETRLTPSTILNPSKAKSEGTGYYNCTSWLLIISATCYQKLKFSIIYFKHSEIFVHALQY